MFSRSIFIDSDQKISIDIWRYVDNSGTTEDFEKFFQNILKQILSLKYFPYEKMFVQTVKSTPKVTYADI